jgi:hypothetical protein
MTSLTQSSPSPSPVDKAREHVRDAVHKASPFVEKFARFGYASKGVVYLIVGALAAMAAFGAGGGETTGSRGALRTIAEQPFGQVLLGVVAFGVLGYSLWQFIRAIEDPENEGSDRKGIGKRIAFFFSGIIHLGLVFAAVGIIRGSGGGGDDDAKAQGWTARLMSYPSGQWVVAAAGLGILCYGARQLYRAFKAKLDKMLALGGMGAGAARAVRYVCRFGMAARGVVFGLIGAFLVAAAIHENPGEARGVGGALDTVARQSYGPWLLGIVALGLVAYGIYELVKARYRMIEVA